MGNKQSYSFEKQSNTMSNKTQPLNKVSSSMFLVQVRKVAARRLLACTQNWPWYHLNKLNTTCAMWAICMHL